MIWEVTKLWRAGFVDFKGALRLLGVPYPYSRAELDEALEKQRILLVTAHQRYVSGEGGAL